jgi:carbamoyltransferase
MVGRKFAHVFGEPVREPESKLTQFHKDVAASLQKVTDTIMVRMAQHVGKETGMKHLCLAGGVALNCVSNSRILENSSFADVFVQPAAGDAGGSVGAAYYVYNTILGKPRTYVMNDVFLGPEFQDEKIEAFLKSKKVDFCQYSRQDLLQETARLIADQKVVGWLQGRMEFGPRALGNRSILADARNPRNQSIVNLKIKFRESFRPFAPRFWKSEQETTSGLTGRVRTCYLWPTYVPTGERSPPSHTSTALPDFRQLPATKILCIMI